MLLRLLLVFFSYCLVLHFAQSLGHMHAIRTNTARNPDQPIAMSKKSSNFALAFGTWVAMADTAPLNQRATKASALPKNPRFSGAPRKMHR